MQWWVTNLKFFVQVLLKNSHNIIHLVFARNIGLNYLYTRSSNGSPKWHSIAYAWGSFNWKLGMHLLVFCELGAAHGICNDIHNFRKAFAFLHMLFVVLKLKENIIDNTLFNGTSVTSVRTWDNTSGLLIIIITTTTIIMKTTRYISAHSSNFQNV